MSRRELVSANQFKLVLIVLLLLMPFANVHQLFGNQLRASLSSNLAVSQKVVTVNYEDKYLSEVLQLLPGKYKIGISFNEEIIPDKKITYSAENVTLEEVLNQILDGTGLHADFKSNPRVFFIKEGQPNNVVQNTITGTVRDAGNNETLPGVNIRVKGSNTGTSTDLEGNYELFVENPQDTLIFSFVGYQTAEVPINGRTAIDVALRAETIFGEGLVVTALGFQVDEDKLGTASSSISSEQLTRAGQDNLLKAISAKAAGLDITSTSGDPGAGSRITIRGAVSLQGNNEPLFIIDGVPISNSNLSGQVPGDIPFISRMGGVVQQSRINDLNPEDIASIEVLKGPAAASLWGSRAANGAIVIQTKKGSLDQDLQVTFNSQITFEEVNKTQSMQQKYGQGLNGEYVWGGQLSWGDKIGDRSGGEDVRARPDFPYSEIIQKNSREVYDQARRFYETGIGYNNSLSLSAGDDKTTIYLSVSNVNKDGIALANSTYDKTSIRANLKRYFTDKLSIAVNTNYFKTDSDRIQNGSNVGGLALGIYRSPPDFNHYPYVIDYIDPNGNVIPNQQRSFQNPDGSELSSGYDNPLWSIYKIRNTSQVNRFLGNTELEYDINSWANIVHRIGIDYYTDRRTELVPPGSSPNPSGSLSEDNYTEYQFNSDLIVRANHQFNENLVASGLLGWNINHRSYDRLWADVSDFILEDAPPNLSNGLNRLPGQLTRIQRTSALYSELTLDVFDQLFLKVSGRSESASTYGTNVDNTYFYPSSSIAWQFTNLDAFSDNDLISFGKLRFSYGQAGVQPGVYNTQTLYRTAVFSDGWGSPIDANAYGSGTTRALERGNPNLKPEITTEYEAGLDLRFLNDRITFSATQYFTKTKDAILNLDIAPTTGFASQIANGAKIENYGTELELGATWIQGNDFRWESNFNWSTNNSEVTDLSGVDNVDFGGFGVTNRAIKGEPFGVLFGPVFERDQSGNYVLNSNGFPVTSASSEIVGDPNPDWRAGVSNTFSYQNLSLSVLFDIKHGGDVWNGTRGVMMMFGTHGSQDWETTAPQDLVNYSGDIISQGTIFRGYVEDFGAGPVAIDETWYRIGPGSGFTGPDGQFVEDGGFVRLKEISLRYSLNSEKFRSFTGLRSLDLSVSANNLHLWTDYSGIDPETNLYGPTNLEGIDYFNNPGIRSWSFSLLINY